MTFPGICAVRLPAYNQFRDACLKGLSVVRPLLPNVETEQLPWNFTAAWPPSYPAFGRMRALLAVKEAVALQPHRMLEVAAGDGSLCAVLESRHCAVVANDLREDQLRDSLQHFTNADRIEVVGGNILELQPEQLGKFDLVVACEIIEHVARSEQFLRHLARFLTAKGHLLVTTPNGAYFRNRLPTWSQVSDFETLESQQFKPDADGHLFLMTPEEFSSLAGRSGLKVTSMGVWGTPFLTGHGKLVKLASRWWTWLTYAAETCAQGLPWGLRKRICFAFTAVLTLSEEMSANEKAECAG
jgi:2-polyprenyl-3-methyl-5-hydroxy-6-metoxy-1,4-benzoquinol methylase